MPRLFTGIELPPDIAFELSLLRGGVPDARWVDAEAMHITLRFIGDVADNTAAELDWALTAFHAEQFSLRLHGAGCFGSRKPRALYIKVEAADQLGRLQAANELACQRIGLPPEGRRYTPHVTLARFRNGRLQPVNDFISRHNLYSSRPFDVPRFVLFSSRPNRGGGPYAIERTYELENST